MTAENDFVHHQAVHALAHALVLHGGEQLLDHQTDDAVLVLWAGLYILPY